MFDYKGYTKEKIEQLCDDKFAHKGFSEWIYWTSEVYSFGKYIRDYGLYPKFLPLMCYCNHGIGDDMVYDHELKNDASCMFVFSDKKCTDYKKESRKPCYIIPAPFVWYRKKYYIEPLNTAKGTLAFPAHTTPEIDLGSDIELYIQELRNLPEEFQPVSVCIHMHDVNKGQHEIFLKHGIPVYTVGNAFDYRFAKRFYDILKNFKYTTSNMVGSYTYYSVEMGIPFSIYGDRPILINNADENIEKGEYQFLKNECYKQSSILFAGLQKEITKEQKEYVEKSLGIQDCASRSQIAKALYGAYLKKGNIFKELPYTLNILRKKIKQKFKRSKR